jgi:hypothetical protein
MRTSHIDRQYSRKFGHFLRFFALFEENKAGGIGNKERELKRLGKAIKSSEINQSRGRCFLKGLPVGAIFWLLYFCQARR